MTDIIGAVFSLIFIAGMVGCFLGMLVIYLKEADEILRKYRGE